MKINNINKVGTISKHTEPIRVLHAVPRMIREGIQSFLMNLYRNIDREKIQFDFLVHSKQDGAFDAEIEQLGGKIYRVNRMSSPHFLHYTKDVAQVLTKYPYKIVHSHINLLSSFTLKVAMKYGIPVRIAHSHSSSILDSGVKRLIKLYAKKQISKYATHFFACSKDAGIWQFGKDAYENGKIKLVPNGIEIEKYLFTQEKRSTIRSKFNLDEDDFVLGHVGGFRRVKNHNFLVDVFAEIKKMRPNSKLLLVGSGELQEVIRNKLERLNILNDANFAGNVENVCDYYSAMDAFIFPSIYEGLPLSLVEAQISGLPCFPSEAVSNEAILSEHYYPLSLEKSPQEWACFILAHLPTETRVCTQAVYKHDMRVIAKDMQEFYLNSL